MTSDRSPHIDPTEDDLFTYAGSLAAQPANDLESTVQRVHRATAAEPNQSMPSDLKAQIWEDLMQAHTTAASPSGADTRRPTPSRSIATRPRPFPRMSATSPWQLAANLALALALLLAIAAGIWRVYGVPDGGDDGPPNVAMAPDNRTMTADSTPQITAPIASPTTAADLPTAEDCTVDPLTIDQVLTYVEHPAGDPVTAPRSESSTPASSMDANATPSGGSEWGPAEPAQLTRMAEVQWMWMACVLADSPFQRWALESPVLVAWEVEAMFPTYYTREDAVTILETVQETGLIEPSEDFWKRPNSTFHMISSFGFPGAISKNKDGSDPQPIISLISQSPDDSVTMDGQRFTVRYVEYIPDGSLMRDTSVYDQPVTADVTSQNTLFNACDAFEFQWYPDVDAVVVSDLPSCG